MIEPDEIDERIVKCLAENGRVSIRSIGRQLGLSEAAVRKRWRRLQDTGAFSYGLVVDLQVTGMAVSGWLSVSARPTHARAAAAAITNLDLCALCGQTTGEFNIVAYLYAKDFEAMACMLREIERFPGVLTTRFRQAVSHPKHRYEYVALSDVGRSPFWQIAEDQDG
jgi:Lrp/AsnC family transcriptional regulator for asnA, asnC and gidA